MRILLLANPASIHTARWANSLAARGHEIHLAHLPDHQPDEQPLDNRVILHGLPFSGAFGYYLNARSLRTLAARLRPDITHAHYASGYGTLARTAGVPYLLSAWGSDVYEFPYRSRLSLHTIRRNLRHALHVTSTSHCMSDQILTVVGGPPIPITVIPFGIDLERFDPAKMAPRNPYGATFRIGNVKTLAEPYGIDVLIRAAALLRRQLPGVEVIVYGDGPLRRELEELITALGLGGVVRLPGPIAHDAVPAALAELDVFCATSLRESFGVAVAEAMAMRRPVVVSDADGFVEVVGAAGLVVPRNDAAETAAALASLAADEGLRSRLATAGRDRVEQNYDWEANVESMLEVYERVTGQ